MSTHEAEKFLMGLSEYIKESLGKHDGTIDVDVRIAAGLPYQSEINVTLNKDYFDRV